MGDQFEKNKHPHDQERENREMVTKKFISFLRCPPMDRSEREVIISFITEINQSTRSLVRVSTI